MNCSLNCRNCTAAIREQEFNSFRDEYKRISGFDYDFIEHSTPSTMLLGLTNDCNLACPYCFVHQDKQEMTFEIADQATQWLLKNIQLKQDSPYDKGEPLIGFFGGEPLLKFEDIIMPLVNKYRNQVKFCITTNGVLLNEDIVDFLYENQVDPLLSFDGIKIVQNLQRPGKECDSFETVLKNIPYLLLRFPDTVMRSTVTKNSIPHLYKTVLMAVELGFKQITFCPNAFENWTKENEEELKEQFDKIGLYIYQELSKNNFPIVVNPINSYYQKSIQAQNNNLFFDNNILRCGLGSTSCAVTPNGEIIPCQEKTSNPTNVIGNIRDGINPELHKKFLEEYFDKINHISCNQGCEYRNKLICLSDLCPSRMEDLNYTFSTSQCAFIRMGVKTAIRLQFLCEYSSKQLFKNYFNEEEDKRID